MSLVKVFANIVRCFDTIFHPDIPIGRGLNYQICYLGPYQTSSFTFILFKTSSKKLNALQHCNITGSKCKSEENIKEAIQHLYFLLGRRHIKLDYKIDNISCVVDLKNFIDIESIYLNQQDLVCSYQEENFPALVIYCPKHITSAAKLCCLVNKSGSCVLVGGKIKSEIVEFFSWLVLKIENYISNKSQDVI